jgi:crotonobetainyl-CoA:carnitine CoA-transferase CaiB-like acyl-CoA transferase
MPDSNHSDHPRMVPHGVYPAAGTDAWIAITCRHDDDWTAFAKVCAEPWAVESRFATLTGRAGLETQLDGLVSAWTSTRDRSELASALRHAGVPASPVAMSEDRIDHDADTAAWGLFPMAHHDEIGDVRVDGVPAHLSATDWHIERGAPLLGQHNRDVFCGLLGLSDDELAALAEGGVV